MMIFHIESLYPNIPIDEANKLIEAQKMNYLFSLISQQIDGGDMGSPLAPTIVDLFITNLEQHHLTVIQNFKLRNKCTV
ncbi:unnamed protein product [Adineta steineri]|uniref:Reverse transcriptase domain-containing protein n=1 Tax=Adineta steineri TaxID=433720 RepID=A0A814JZM1_9BILA|nr:unnamed protein product [Adineta steineri]CAF1044280.1 unnamed protein product [Adineta steineri]